MRIRKKRVSIWFLGLGLLVFGLNGASSVTADEPQHGEVESRGMPSIPQKLQPSAAKPMQEPSWPQKFNVRGPETDSFGFAVTQPGPIIIDVQSQGPPITVTLRGPGLSPHMERGAGSVRLTHQVAAQDVAQGMFWSISIGLQQPGPAQAVGQVMVQHPPADPAKVQAAVAAQQQSVQQQAAQRQATMQQAGAQATVQMEAAFQQRKAQFEQQRHQRHAALMAQAQPMIDRLRMKGPGQVRTRGVEESDSAPAEASSQESTDIESRGVSKTRPTGPMVQAQPNTSPFAKKPQLQGTNTSPPLQSTSSALTYMPDPVITALSVTQGQPGDPVMINGTGFSDGGGEVHFVIGPGKDLIAPAGVVWQNDQIFATVPEAVGLVGFSGIAYVVRASDKRKSNVTQFEFKPDLELRILTPIRSDVVLQPFDGIDLSLACRNFAIGDGDHCWTARINPYVFWGPKGNDQFFVNARLQNGWLVFQEPTLYFPLPSYMNGGAYHVESRVATDSPYVNIRWWIPGGVVPIQKLAYGYSMLIQGPKGVPDGVVCKQSPC
jgi:hypothetical protein